MFYAVRSLLALSAIGFQVWYLLNVGFLDVTNTHMFRDDSVLRGVLTFLAVQGVCHLFVAYLAPRDVALTLTKLSAYPVALPVVIATAISLVTFLWLYALAGLVQGNAGGLFLYAGLFAYSGAAWWSTRVAAERTLGNDWRRGTIV